MGRNNFGATGKAGDRLMCHLCEERFASVSPVVDETVSMQTVYRQDHPERTQGQRVSDLANVFLTMVSLPVEPETSPNVVEAVKNMALLLAAMTERVMDLKRVN